MADQNDKPLDWDRLEGVSHPRETSHVYGHDAAIAEFNAARTERLHHAWMICGPRGVGKATTAYALARALLRLDDQSAHASDAQIRAGAHPGLFEIRRSWNSKSNALRGEIVVDDIRRLARFFGLSATDGGWRVALIDPVDDLNLQAANALLKALEEPPQRALFLLTCNTPGRLPPTILSRCRRLQLRSLSDADATAALRAAAPDIRADEATALARLVRGSPGEALRLRAEGGLDIWSELVALHGALPAIDRAALDKLMSAAGGKSGAPFFELLMRLWPMLFEQLALCAARAAEGAANPNAAPEIALLAAKIAPSAQAARLWAETSSSVREKLEVARALNLDPERTILDTALSIEEAARNALVA